MNIKLIGGAVGGVVVVIAVVILFSQNLVVMEAQEKRLNQLELEQQYQRDIQRCEIFLDQEDFDRFYGCMDRLFIDYDLPPELIAAYEREKQMLKMQNSMNYNSNCKLSPMQQQQLESIKNDDSIADSVKLSQSLMIMQQGCN